MTVNSSGRNIATVVGPDVPSVLLLVIAFFGFRWYKRRQKKNATEATEVSRDGEGGDEEAKFQRAQPHSDCVLRPVYEMRKEKESGDDSSSIENSFRPGQA
ncbi:hypothetical protein FZEAL_2288 [Fusarium zealandicum]|uniref:Uncharacterized protein n=1 Tax=Fusarium zealandicum TaxID=1053134 RepID=A0A8H4XP15_9HYPO|nr:hypothetical protein FZEAL_2288 [Fusarium zealandicum]